jgi:hypothetical protein
LHLLRTGKKDDILDISPITDNLFICGWPSGKHAPQIAELGITFIISMIREKQDIELTQPHIHKRIVKFAAERQE